MRKQIDFLFACKIAIGVVVLLSAANEYIDYYHNIIGNAIIRTCIFLAVIFGVIRQLKLDSNELFINQKINETRTVQFALVFILPLFLFTSLVTEMEALLKMGQAEYFSKYYKIFSLGSGAKYFITILIIGPIVEELFFRGLILGSFRKTYSYQKALIYSSLVFSLVHIRLDETFLSSIIYSFLSGLLYGWIYLNTKNIGFVMFMHFAWNLLTYLFPLLLFQLGLQVRNIGDFATIALILSIVVLVGFVISYSLYKKIDLVNNDLN
ncbi:hypothetical protein WSM22_46990 [Cytophagales bacterium WSM2-2]|nr:hypothetical protein WSM22_46990 [Cytophagales bacterium WSM2-2]